MSQQKWRMNIQKFEVEAEESNKKSQDHLNSMPQSLPTQKTENFKFSRNLWKSGICHFWSSVTHHWWNRIFRILHFTEWLLCVNTAYPDGLRFYDFQILSSGFLVNFFFESHFTSSSGICTYAYGTYGHQSSAGTDTIVCRNRTLD